MPVVRGPKGTQKLAHDLMASLVVLERRDGRKEVARLRQALRPDGAELREPEWRTVVLTDITARLLFEQLKPEFHAAGHHGYFARRHSELAKLGEKQDFAKLRHEHELAVAIDEHALGHRTIRAIEVHRDAYLRGGLAAARERRQPVDEIRRRFADRQGVPAQPVGRRL